MALCRLCNVIYCRRWVLAVLIEYSHRYIMYYNTQDTLSLINTLIKQNTFAYDWLELDCFLNTWSN